MIKVTKNQTLSKRIDKEIFEIQMINKYGESVNVLNYGCIIKEICVLDKDQNIENVVLEYEDDSMYVENPIYLNALIGRNAGRIENGFLQIDDTFYHLDKNNPPNNLHGGFNALNSKVWSFDVFEGENYDEVRFKYFSPHLENGFPGNVKIEVIYAFNDASELSIEYSGVSDKDTLLNLTNHAYFNLSGNNKETIYNQHLLLNACYYQPLKKNHVPSIEPVYVENTAFDLRKKKALSTIIHDLPTGLDHPFKLDFNTGHSKLNQPHIILQHPQNRRVLTIYSNQPYAIVYSSNEALFHHRGICFEMQQLPSSVQPLKKEEQYFNKSIYKFSVE